MDDQSPRAETHSLLLLCLVLLCAVIEQLLVHLHKQLQGVVDQPMDCPASRGKMGCEGQSLSLVPGPTMRSSRRHLC